MNLNFTRFFQAYPVTCAKYNAALSTRLLQESSMELDERIFEVMVQLDSNQCGEKDESITISKANADQGFTALIQSTSK